MRKTRLILVDGISGLGKSTTAQWLAQVLESNGLQTKWFHEEEVGHPLGSRFDVENLQGQEEVAGFMSEVPELWAQLLQQARQNETVYIVESILLQDTARVLFQNCVPREQIDSLVKGVLHHMAELNPVLIYLWQEDVGAAMRRIWARRGEQWAHWAIETDANTPYSKQLDGGPEERAITLWRDYQLYALKLLKQLALPNLSVENSEADWSSYQEQMLNFLELDPASPFHDQNDEDICGDYEYRSAKHLLTATISLYGERLVINGSFLWPNMWLQPIGQDKCLIESLPVTVDISRSADGQVLGFRLSGPTRYNGAYLRRV